jgi:hypothetical protein
MPVLLAAYKYNDMAKTFGKMNRNRMAEKPRRSERHDRQINEMTDRTTWGISGSRVLAGIEFG